MQIFNQEYNFKKEKKKKEKAEAKIIKEKVKTFANSGQFEDTLWNKTLKKDDVIYADEAYKMFDELMYRRSEDNKEIAAIKKLPRYQTEHITDDAHREVE